MNTTALNARPRNPMRINLESPAEVEYWCSRFGIDRDRLRRAVSEVGTASRNVARALGRSWFAC